MAGISCGLLFLRVAILVRFALAHLPSKELPGGRGGQVPSVLFRDQRHQPAAFYPFVLALVLSAPGIIIHHRSSTGYARLCRGITVGSMMVGFGALLWACSSSALTLWQARKATTTVADW